MYDFFYSLENYFIQWKKSINPPGQGIISGERREKENTASRADATTHLSMGTAGSRLFRLGELYGCSFF